MTAWPQRVLVGVDGSPGSAAAVAFGRVLQDWTGAEISIGCAFGGSRWFPEPGSAMDAEAVLDAATGEVPEAGAWARLVLEAASPANGLEDAIDRVGADLVVIGSSHRGPVGRVVPGSTSEHLLAEARSALAVVPSGYELEAEAGLRVVGVGFDGTAESHAALRRAEDLARTAGGALRVYSVLLPVQEEAGAAALAPSPPVGSLSRDLAEAQAAAVRGLDPAVRALPVTLRGDSATELLEHAEEVEAMLIGARPLGRLGRVLAGSVGLVLMSGAPCPVIVVPGASGVMNQPDS